MKSDKKLDKFSNRLVYFRVPANQKFVYFNFRHIDLTSKDNIMPNGVPIYPTNKDRFFGPYLYVGRKTIAFKGRPPARVKKMQADLVLTERGIVAFTWGSWCYLQIFSYLDGVDLPPMNFIHKTI